MDWQRISEDHGRAWAELDSMLGSDRLEGSLLQNVAELLEELDRLRDMRMTLRIACKLARSHRPDGNLERDGVEAIIGMND